VFVAAQRHSPLVLKTKWTLRLFARRPRHHSRKIWGTKNPCRLAPMVVLRSVRIGALIPFSLPNFRDKCLIALPNLTFGKCYLK
jgi:hypothetical protein